MSAGDIIICLLATAYLALSLIWLGDLRALNPWAPIWLIIVMAALWPYCEWQAAKGRRR